MLRRRLRDRPVRRRHRDQRGTPLCGGRLELPGLQGRPGRRGAAGALPPRGRGARGARRAGGGGRPRRLGLQARPPPPAPPPGRSGRAGPDPPAAGRAAGESERVRLHFLLARRVPPVLSPVLREVFRLLEAEGFEIDSATPEEVVTRPDRLAARHDLYVLKSHTELALSLAGVLHARGARVLNPYPSCLATQNKIIASGLLWAARVPAPDVWVTGDLRLLRDVAAARPLIIKPYLGHRGAGLRLVRDPAELDALAPLDGPVIVQEYVEGGGEDLKVYVVGDYVAAVRKPFSPDSFTLPGRPAPASPEVRDIALRCRRAFRRRLFGLEVGESPRGPPGGGGDTGSVLNGVASCPAP